MEPRVKSQPNRATDATNRRPAPRLWPVVGGLAIAAMVLTAYAPLVRAGFIWDDESYITDNTTLRSLDGLWRIWFEVGAVPQYYPLVHTTFWVEYHLWELAPLGFHVVNVVLHLSSALLLWRMLLVLQVPGAWLAAAIFAVHPVEVESVAWVTERKNVLSLMLALTSMLCYLRFAPPEEVVAGTKPAARRWRWYALATLFFVAALLSKTVVASLPAVLLVIYWWRRGRVTRWDVLPLVPFLVFAVSLGLLTVWLEKYHVGAIGREWDFTPIQRLLIAGRAVWFYAGKLAWPHPLIFSYPRWDIESGLWWQYLFPAAAVGLIGALWLARGQIGRGPLAAVLIFAGVLVPALGFFNVYPFRFSFVADHFQYHASLALLVLAAAGATLATARLSRAGRITANFAAGALCVALVMLTAHQALIYQDLETLYRDTIAKNPGGWLAYSNLGVYLGQCGQIDEALDLCRKAVQLQPDDENTQYNLGLILLKVPERDGYKPGQLDAAMQHFEKAIEQNPRSTRGHTGMGLALFNANRHAEAIAHFAKTLEVRPAETKALNGMGGALAAMGKWAEAQGYFEKSMRLEPDSPEAYLGRADLFLKQDRHREAIADFEKALEIKQHGTSALNNLAWLLATSPDETLRDGKRAIQLATLACQETQYQRAQFLSTLAAGYAETGDFASAIQWSKQAIELADETARPALAKELECYQASKPWR